MAEPLSPDVTQIETKQQTPVEEPVLPPAHPILNFIGYMESVDRIEALVSGQALASDQWVRTGDSIDGWTVETISRQKIIFAQSSHVFVVEFIQ